MATSRFPHSGHYKFGDHELTAVQVLALLAPFMTGVRQEKIRATIERRSYEVTTVLENIYDRGNISAVLRSAEAMGFQSAHIIEFNDKFKSANRVTQGADKWLDVTRWKSTVECVRHLKSQGYQVLATHLDAKAKPIGEIDFTKPSAIVFGNEKDGISPEMIAECDQTVIIPMRGLVQSFNISVAAAIGLYHAYREREQKLGVDHQDLTPEQQIILRADFSLRSSDNPERLISELIARQSPT